MSSPVSWKCVCSRFDNFYNISVVSELDLKKYASDQSIQICSDHDEGNHFEKRRIDLSPLYEKAKKDLANHPQLQAQECKLSFEKLALQSQLIQQQISNNEKLDYLVEHKKKTSEIQAKLDKLETECSFVKEKSENNEKSLRECQLETAFVKNRIDVQKRTIEELEEAIQNVKKETLQQTEQYEKQVNDLTAKHANDLQSLTSLLIRLSLENAKRVNQLTVFISVSNSAVSSDSDD